MWFSMLNAGNINVIIWLMHVVDKPPIDMIDKIITDIQV